MLLNEKVYDFSNENLTESFKLFDLPNKKVLTVLGSGDQYFTALLNGAKKIEVFDNNKLTWYYFILKFMAIKHLSYEEFFKFFVTDGLDNKEIYQKIEKYLPEYVSNYFKLLEIMHKPLSSIKYKKLLSKKNKVNNGIYIPYLKKEEYYHLKDLLNKTELPYFYNTDLLDLSKNEYYDVIILSNIINYVMMDPQSWYDFLYDFNCPHIEAVYAWFIENSEKEAYLNCGFQDKYVPSSAEDEPIDFFDGCPKDKNIILTLDRR